MRKVLTYTLENEAEAKYVCERVNQELYLQQIGNRFTIKPR